MFLLYGYYTIRISQIEIIVNISYCDIVKSFMVILMRLKDLREDNDVKQKHLAEYLNIKQNTYSQYENGKREIPLEMLCKLADFYNTSVDYIIGRTDNPTKL